MGDFVLTPICYTRLNGNVSLIRGKFYAQDASAQLASGREVPYEVLGPSREKGGLDVYE